MPKIKLASEKLRGGSGSPAGQLDAGAGFLSGQMSTASASPSALRAPQINANAARVTFTPTPLPNINVDNTILNAAAMSGVWEQAAREYSARETKVRANDAYLQVNDALRSQFYGSMDQEGNRTPGYSETEGIAASDAYADHLKGMDQSIQKVLEGYDDGVKREAMLRIAETRNTYLNRAASHRSNQLKVAEQNALAKSTENVLQETAGDPNSLFNLNPVTGNTKIDDFAARYGDTYIERETIKQGLIASVFDQVRYSDSYTPGQEKQESYASGYAWFKQNEGNFHPQVASELKQKLGVMETAAKAEKKASDKKFLAAQLSSFAVAGGDALHAMMANGNYEGLGGYVNAAKLLNPDDEEAQKNMVIAHMKQALSLTAKNPKQGYAAAAEQAAAMTKYAKDNGIDFMQSGYVFNEIDEYLRDDLPSELAQITKAQQTASDNAGIAALSGLYQKSQEDIDSSGKIYQDATTVREDYDNLVIQTGDSKAVAAEKIKRVESIIKYSQDRNNKNVIPNTENVMNTLRTLDKENIMFSSDAEFDLFMLKNGVTKDGDQTVLRNFRQNLKRPEEDALNSYAKGVLTTVKTAFRPTTEASLKFEGIYGPQDILIDTRDAPAEEINLRNEIMEEVNDVRKTPKERAEAVKVIIQRTLTETGKNTLQEALNVKAIGVRTDHYMNAQQVMQRGVPARSTNIPEPPLVRGSAFTPDPTNVDLGVSQKELADILTTNLGDL